MLTRLGRRSRYRIFVFREGTLSYQSPTSFARAAVALRGLTRRNYTTDRDTDLAWLADGHTATELYADLIELICEIVVRVRVDASILPLKSAY